MSREKRNVDGLGDRLREERDRLGLTQGQVASIGQVAGSAQSRYESGQNVPDAKYLSELAASGADVLYIVTGRREAVGRLNEVLLRALVNRVVGLYRRNPGLKIPADSMVVNMYRKIASRYKPDDDINNLVDEELEYVVSMLPKPGDAEEGAEG